MLLTRNNAALALLFDRGILCHNKAEIIFASDFPSDHSDLQVCYNLQRVKQAMACGATAVLVHCDQLYESLYDLLNQHFVIFGGRRFVRLAFGTHSQMCPLADGFRAVVVVDTREAYARLSPPLLNRFEK
ncbi:unnamed protein product, partial [Phaeothamnion confervicola]